MDKRKEGELLCLIGMPAAIGWTGIMGVFSGGGGNPAHLLWAVPLALVTLPTLPALLKGERMLRELDQEAFDNATAALPHIVLPKEACWLDIAEDGTTYIGPQYDEYTDEANARSWLQANGYQEVVASEHRNSTSTWFVKKENING